MAVTTATSRTLLQVIQIQQPAFEGQHTTGVLTDCLRPVSDKPDAVDVMCFSHLRCLCAGICPTDAATAAQHWDSLCVAFFLQSQGQH